MQGPPPTEIIYHAVDLLYFGFASNEASVYPRMANCPFLKVVARSGENFIVSKQVFGSGHVYHRWLAACSGQLVNRIGYVKNALPVHGNLLIPRWLGRVERPELRVV